MLLFDLFRGNPPKVTVQCAIFYQRHKRRKTFEKFSLNFDIFEYLVMIIGGQMIKIREKFQLLVIIGHPTIQDMKLIFLNIKISTLVIQWAPT